VESWFKPGLRLQEETQCAYNLVLRGFKGTVVAVGKAGSVEYLEYVKLLFIVPQ
jgi:hypothetical protein